jgi:hypothetical protein
MAMKPVPPQLEHSRSLIGSFGHPPHRAAFSLLLNLIPFIILEHLGVGVDDFSVLGSREVQAGPAQRIGQADGLRHGVGIFAPVIEGSNINTAPSKFGSCGRLSGGSNGNLRISFTGCPRSRVEKRMS